MHVVVHVHLERTFTELDLGGLGSEERGPESLGLLLEPLHEFGTHDSLGKTGKVLDLGGEHQLTAGLIARARRFTFDHERSQIGPGRVDGGGESGRTRSDDDDAMMLTHQTPSLL